MTPEVLAARLGAMLAATDDSERMAYTGRWPVHCATGGEFLVRVGRRSRS